MNNEFGLAPVRVPAKIRERMIDEAVRRFPFMISRVKATDRQGCGITIHPGEAEAIRVEFRCIEQEAQIVA